MDAFRKLTGLVAPIDRPNVDTDAIIPKQFLKSIKRAGFGPNLFDEWRYLDKGEPDKPNAGRPLNPDFVLNQPRYQGAQILLARDNFGCGSSREHAPWAIHDFGFRAVIAPSFADIFYGNSAKNGLLLVTLPAAIVERLFADCARTEGYALTIDLETQTVTEPDGTCHAFDYSAGLKHRMLNGLDDIGITLQHADRIRAYEARRRDITPWLFADA
ncbi:MAG: 3-isopropylmalate dehydratase small subunit [Gammaproteobacteria bacterium]|nr:3-isopropylmalate dehydratase small subunit [Gammaproteobacteria bacterium]